MTTTEIELLTQAEQDYRSTLDADIDLIELLVHSDGETGVFLAPDGDIYDFAYVRDSNEIIVVRDDVASNFFEDFAQGYLESQGVSNSLFRNDAAGFYLGTMQSRFDKVGGKCGRGWEMGSGGKCMRTKGGGKLKQGGLGRKAALAGAGAVIAGGTAAGALLGGTKAGRAAVNSAKNQLRVAGAAVNPKGEDLKGLGVKGRSLVAKHALKGAAGSLKEGVVGGAKEVAGNIKQGVGTAKAKAEELGNKAKSKASEVGSKAKEAATKAGEKAKEVKGKAKQKMAEAKDKATTAAASAMTGVKVKKEPKD